MFPEGPEVLWVRQHEHLHPSNIWSTSCGFSGLTPPGHEQRGFAGRKKGRLEATLSRNLAICFSFNLSPVMASVPSTEMTMLVGTLIYLNSVSKEWTNLALTTSVTGLESLSIKGIWK